MKMKTYSSQCTPVALDIELPFNEPLEVFRGHSELLILQRSRDRARIRLLYRAFNRKTHFDDRFLARAINAACVSLIAASTDGSFRFLLNKAGKYPTEGMRINQLDDA